MSLATLRFVVPVVPKLRVGEHLNILDPSKTATFEAELFQTADAQVMRVFFCPLCRMAMGRPGVQEDDVTVRGLATFHANHQHDFEEWV